jgi:predicted PurR-regulated permease PerM
MELAPAGRASYSRRGKPVPELTSVRTEVTSETAKERRIVKTRMLKLGHELGLDSPDPVKNVSTVWRTLAQMSTIGMFFIAFIVALYLARPVLLPTVSAFVIGLMLGPISTWFRRMGAPSVVVAFVLWFAVIALCYAIVALLTTPAVEWIGKGPEIATSIKDKLHVFDHFIASLKSLRDAVLPESDNKGLALDLASILQPTLIFVTPAVGQVFIFFGTLFFFLLGRAQLRHVMIFFFAQREARLRMLKIFNDVEYNLTTYLSVVAIINAVVGIAAFAVAWGVGLPNPLAWGVLAFLLNFIPYVGALIMELVLLLAGLVTFDTLTHAILAPALFLAFTTLEGHFVTPAIMGKRLTLNPLTVFLALIFWTWLWGPVGAFLAVPLLIVALVVINHLFPKSVPELPE